jgi:hypothetical protein
VRPHDYAGQKAIEVPAGLIDLSHPQQLGLARERCRRGGATQVQLRAGRPCNSFDLGLACLMFFAEPIAAFRNIRRAMKPGVGNL